MKNQKIIFILIGAFCVLALIAGIYAQFFVGGSNNSNTQNLDLNINNEIKPKTQEAIKSQLTSLFTNEILSNNYDETNLQKRDTSKGIVYSAYDIQKQEKTNESLTMQVNELTSFDKIKDVVEEMGLAYNNENILVVTD